MENLSRLNFGTVDSLGRYGLGSLESLGRPVEQDMRGVGFPAPTSSMDSLGKMDFGSMDSLGQVNFGSMESLAQVVKNGDLPGPSGAERYQGFGSSMENLSRVLERSTPANTAQTRDAGDHEPSGDMDGFVGPDANSVMADVMSGGLITVSHGKEQVKDGEAIAYGGGPDLGSMDTEGDTGQGADEFRDGRDIMADDHAQVVTAVRQDRVPDTPAAAETPPNIVAENVPTRERASEAERPESVAIAEAQNRQNVPTPHQDTAASLDEGLSNKAGGTDISAEAQTPVVALDEPLAAEGSTDRTSLDEGREHLQEIADDDKVRVLHFYQIWRLTTAPSVILHVPRPQSARHSCRDLISAIR